LPSEFSIQMIAAKNGFCLTKGGKMTINPCGVALKESKINKSYNSIFWISINNTCRKPSASHDDHLLGSELMKLKRQNVLSDWHKGGNL
jgi:hypothetical protein